MVISEVFDQLIWRGKLPSNQLSVFHFLACIPNTVGSIVPSKPFKNVVTRKSVGWI